MNRRNNARPQSPPVAISHNGFVRSRAVQSSANGLRRKASRVDVRHAHAGSVLADGRAARRLPTGRPRSDPRHDRRHRPRAALAPHVSCPAATTCSLQSFRGACASFATARSTPSRSPAGRARQFRRVASNPSCCIRSLRQMGFVYLSYVKTGDAGTTVALARARFDGKALSDVDEIFVADAWGSGATAGRAEFGPDGMLYLTVGDRDAGNLTDDSSYRMLAQHLDNRRRQGLAASRRRHGSARQSVRRPRRCASGRSTPTGTATLKASRGIRKPAKCGRPRSGRWAATSSTACSPGETTGGRSCRSARSTTATSYPSNPGGSPASRCP